jgi:hypothetical protein
MNCATCGKPSRTGIRYFPDDKGPSWGMCTVCMAFYYPHFTKRWYRLEMKRPVGSRLIENEDFYDDNLL